MNLNDYPAIPIGSQIKVVKSNYGSLFDGLCGTVVKHVFFTEGERFGYYDVLIDSGVEKTYLFLPQEVVSIKGG